MEHRHDIAKLALYEYGGSPRLYWCVSACRCVRACVREHAYVYACVCVCVRVCLGVRVYTRACGQLRPVYRFLLHLAGEVIKPVVRWITEDTLDFLAAILQYRAAQSF